MTHAIIEEYRRLSEKLPYQAIADTPTVRYYTDWRVYDERLGLSDSTREHELPWDSLGDLEPDIVLGLDYVVSSGLKGVRVEELRKEDDEAMKLIGVNTKMQAVHAYRWNRGLRITISDGVDFGRLVIASKSGDAYMGHHLVIRAGKGVRGTIVLVDHAGPSDSLKTLVVEGVIGDSSRVDVDTIHVHSPRHAAYVQLYFKIGEGAAVNARSLVVGGAMTRLQADYVLEGRESRAILKASGLARRGTKTDMILNVINVGERSEGFTGSRGIVLTGGYLALRGLAKITQSAKWASSEVESRVTILGSEGKGYAVPILEIFSGDVTKAAHSAAVSNILEDHIFYLKSRGLSQRDIEVLLVNGMLAYSEVTEKYSIDPARLIVLD